MNNSAKELLKNLAVGYIVYVIIGLTGWIALTNLGVLYQAAQALFPIFVYILTFIPASWAAIDIGQDVRLKFLKIKLAKKERDSK